MTIRLMKTCRTCGSELGDLPFTCSYCDEDFCVNHRLPEQHQCKSFPQRGPDGQWFENKQTSEKNQTNQISSRSRSETEGPQPIPADELQTYGGPTKTSDWKQEARERDAGPDVAPDGSIIKSGTEDLQPTDDEPLTEKNRWMLLLLLGGILVATLLILFAF